jgi:hypothetical protein
VQTKTYQPILLPGIYTAKAALHFGKNNLKTFQSITFFSLGSFDISKIIIILILIGGLVIVYKQYKKSHSHSMPTAD